MSEKIILACCECDEITSSEEFRTITVLVYFEFFTNFASISSNIYLQRHSRRHISGVRGTPHEEQSLNL